MEYPPATPWSDEELEKLARLVFLGSYLRLGELPPLLKPRADFNEVYLASHRVHRDLDILHSKIRKERRSEIAARWGVTINRIDSLFTRAVRRTRHPDVRLKIWEPHLEDHAE